MTDTSATTVWTPTSADVEAAALTDFTRFAAHHAGIEAVDYQQLYAWSVTRPAQFWATLWDYFDVLHSGSATPVLESAAMPGARWFPHAALNYVDQVARWCDAEPERIAIRYLGEDGTRRALTWAEVIRQVGALAGWLRSHGVRPGDRVAAYLPNIPETVIAFLATASIGATWAACGQDYPPAGAVDRLGQLSPTILITADGYRYGGKTFSRTAAVATIRSAITSLEQVIVVTHLGDCDPIVDVTPWSAATSGDAPLSPVRLAFDHPLWVVFSSGTTGRPKGIVHGHGGALLEHLKSIGLQMDISRDSTFWWYTSTSWMMWNIQVAGLLVGATIVCADGNPAYPNADTLFHLAAEAHVTELGTSPGYVQNCARSGCALAQSHDLRSLRSVGVTGSAMPPSATRWLTDSLGGGVPVFVTSGGTDVVTSFVGGVRTLPVTAGEMSVPTLGVALAAFDPDGRSVRNEVAELVVTQPMPSMPVSFWDDSDGARYIAAYFDVYPEVWRHGDWITITDSGSVIIHGRSDSTLNRNGIRMGSADIYQVTDHLTQIVESLVIGVERPEGRYWMPLFVVLADGAVLDDELTAHILSQIRDNASPRHVPDEVIAAPGIPHTRTGKKLEIPVKRLLQGAAIGDVIDPSAMEDPAVLAWYAGQRPRAGLG